ncbi:MAG: carboxypeptidase-like regulatory domain-containing protein [Chloroflexi bacterium]|nr:carboxypeptidase-like regulatory domain-containing protein [Chloroflexota bacterium]
MTDAESGAGIGGATVLVQDNWAAFSEAGRSETAADGSYEITGITLERGPSGRTHLIVRVLADGYISDSHGWESPPPRFSVDFELEPASASACTVVGSVRDQAGREVAGAAVTASTTYPWQQRRTTTGSDGRYEIPDIFGHYFLDVTAEGYDEPPTQEFSCEDADQDLIVERDFTLEAGSPIADPDFIRWFWNQLVFNAFDCQPGRCGAPLDQRSSYVLSTSSPDFHIRTHDDDDERIVSEEKVQQIRAEIPSLVAKITGQPFGGRISDGSQRSGSRITIEFLPEEDLGTDLCGKAGIGSAQSLVQINSQALSRDEFNSVGQGCPLLPVLRHEVAHAMGFFHVTYGGDLMSWLPEYVSDFSAREVYHMQRAYDRGSGRIYEEVSPARPRVTGGRPPITIECHAPRR